jgi:cell wall-associated NlpC family hydrolase
MMLVVLLLSGCHNNKGLAHNFQAQHKVMLSSDLATTQDDSTVTIQAKKPATTKKTTSKQASTKKKQLKQVSASQAKAALMAQYKEWKHVRYRLGGTSKHGIDCSGFAQTTFASKFDVQLPRDTSRQANVGKTVTKKSLRVGDLVFFRIGHNTRHVGIYLGDQQFLHASTSKGVIISQLNNSYWNKHYWKGVRVAGI